MKKTAIALSVAMLCSTLAPVAHASLIKKAAKVALVVGIGAAAAAKAKAAGAPAPAPAESAPAAATPSASPAPASAPVLTPGAPTSPAKPDADAMIDKGAAKAKSATAAFKGWLAKKKAELEAKKAQLSQPTGPTAAPPAGGQTIPTR